MILNQIRDLVCKDDECLYALDTFENKLIVSSSGNASYNTICTNRLSGTNYIDDSECLGLIQTDRISGYINSENSSWVGGFSIPFGISPDINNLTNKYNFSIICKFIPISMSEITSGITKIIWQGDTNLDHVFTISYDHENKKFIANVSFYTGGTSADVITNEIPFELVNETSYVIFVKIDLTNHLLKFSIDDTENTEIITSDVTMLNYPISGSIDESLLKINVAKILNCCITNFMIFNRSMHSNELIAWRKMM